MINPSSSNRLRFRVISATIARKTTFRPKSNQRSQTITRLQINHRISQKMSHQGARMMEIISVGWAARANNTQTPTGVTFMITTYSKISQSTILIIRVHRTKAREPAAASIWPICLNLWPSSSRPPSLTPRRSPILPIVRSSKKRCHLKCATSNLWLKNRGVREPSKIACKVIIWTKIPRN